jgi:hypothetical protein
MNSIYPHFSPLATLLVDLFLGDEGRNEMNRGGKRR